MAKREKVISEVTLKDPNTPLELPRLGINITAQNLTVERYEKLISVSEDFKQYFNVKLTNKQNEPEMEA